MVQWARRFGLTGRESVGTTEIRPDRLAYTEGLLEVHLYRASGGVRFYDRGRWQRDDGKSRFSLSDDDAASVARRHLSRLQIGKSTEQRLFKIARLHVAHADREGAHREERTIDAGVCFQRVLGGIPVEGPGSKVVAYIGPDAELTGVERLWREIRGVARRAPELKQPEEAIEEVRRRWTKGGRGTVEIYEIRFGYFELGWAEIQRHLEPAYVMFLRLVSPDSRFARRSVHVSPAARRSAGSIVLRTPRPPHIEPREGRSSGTPGRRGTPEASE
ncbi:MAG TPA: hypothetical protein VFF67_06170 [Thermoplasmata archaeon]|nr:hypothetical protein [Thermoplasmata archaeon]